MSLPHKRSHSNAKMARLKQWGESENEDILPQLDEMDEDSFLPDQLQTSKFTPSASYIKRPAATGSGRAMATISPGLSMKFVEPENEEDEMLFDEADLDMRSLRLEERIRPISASETHPSPGAGSLASPIRRHSLSNYSEGTDTDITEMNDEDFEEIDDIFGKEESGIYSRGDAEKSLKEGGSRAKEVLYKRKLQLEKEAQLEDRELYMRYLQQHEKGGRTTSRVGEESNTLRLKDLSTIYTEGASKEKLEAENTINYEYTKDDFESFEDGFVGDLQTSIKPGKLKQFYSSSEVPTRLSKKASMPLFPNSLRASRPTKFKSTLDLAGVLGKNESVHPLFNNKNNIIKKLDRMPSFHIKKAQAQAPAPAPSHSNEDMLDYNMELRKKQLLEKYMELTERQFQLRSSPKKSSGTTKLSKPNKRGVGIVRYLNDKSSVPMTTGNKHMKFNANSKTWEGNDHDLLRFEDAISSLTKKQPALITSDEFRSRKETIKGNMVYDPENLRWVNLDSRDEEQENVFDDVPDLVPNDIPSYASSRLTSKFIPTERGVSTFTQRTTSTASTGSSLSSSKAAGDEFNLSERLIARFEKEQMKIKKKTHNWFGPNETYHINRPNSFDYEYFWDIRKMVVDGD